MTKAFYLVVYYILNLFRKLIKKNGLGLKVMSHVAQYGLKFAMFWFTSVQYHKCSVMGTHILTNTSAEAGSVCCKRFPRKRGTVLAQLSDKSQQLEAQERASLALGVKRRTSLGMEDMEQEAAVGLQC